MGVENRVRVLLGEVAANAVHSSAITRPATSAPTSTSKASSATSKSTAAGFAAPTRTTWTARSSSSATISA